MKQRVLSLFVLLCMVCTGAWADVVASIQPCTDYPTYQYTIKMSDDSYYWDANTRASASGTAKFAFYAVSGKADTYYIYSVDGGGWLNYNNSSINNGKGFIQTTLASTKENAKYFKITYVTGTGGAAGKVGFVMAPYTSSGTASTDRFLNYHGGIGSAAANTQVGSQTVGIWEDGSTDKGSIWVLNLDESLPKTYGELISTIEADYASKDISTKGSALLTSENQYSSNASDEEEGTSFAVLYDNNDATFWHSNWHPAGSSPAYNTHYIQVDLGENKTGSFMASIVRRWNNGSYCANDNPTAFRVEASEEPDANFTEIVSSLSYPHSTTLARNTEVSNIFKLNNSARYVRFWCTATNAGNRGYFHLGEFQVYNYTPSYNSEHAQQASDLQSALTTAKAKKTGVTQQDIDNLQAAYDAYLGNTGQDYTIHITGVTENVSVSYDDHAFYNNEQIHVEGSLNAEDIHPEEVEGYTVKVTISDSDINVVYTPYYYVVDEFRNHKYTESNMSNFKPNRYEHSLASLQIGEESVSTLEYDPIESGTEYAAYRDLTETAIFHIPANSSQEVHITLAGGGNSAWKATHIYVDANKDKQFTMTNPEELVCSFGTSSQATNYSNTYGNFTSPSENGVYRARLILCGNDDKNPAGSSSYTTDSKNGRIVDFTLNVGDPTQYTVRIVGGEENTQVTYNGQAISNNGNFATYDYNENLFSAPVLYGKDCRVEKDGTTITVTYTDESVQEVVIYNTNAERFVKSNLHGSTADEDAAVFCKVATGKQVDYNGGAADVFLLRLGNEGYIGQYTNANMSTKGNDKFAFTMNKSEALEFIYSDADTKDIIPVVSFGAICDNDNSKGQLSWNWYGGFGNGADPSLGLYGTKDSNSQWEFKGQYDKVREDITALITLLTRYKNYIGTGLGKYTVNNEEYNTGEKWQYALTRAQNILTLSQSSLYIETRSTLQTMQGALVINQPAPGKFYRFVGVNPNDRGKYLTNNSGTLCSATNDRSDVRTLWYFTEDRKLVAYNDGKMIKSVDMVTKGDGNDGDVIYFSESKLDKSNSNFVIGSYAIRPASYGENQGLINWTNFHTSKMYATTAADARCQWSVEEVEVEVDCLPVTISAVKYATFYTPVDLIVPSGVTAYVCSMNDNTINMYTINQTDGVHQVIPANTGVLLHENEHSDQAYEFYLASDNVSVEPYSNNAFVGDVATSTIDNNYYWYSLQKSINYATDGTIAFYSKTSGTLGGFKAFLKSPVEGGVRQFTLSFGEEEQTTGIDEIIKAMEENGVAYDLAGRRLNKAQKGINIINGAKVIR